MRKRVLDYAFTAVTIGVATSLITLATSGCTSNSAAPTQPTNSDAAKSSESASSNKDNGESSESLKVAVASTQAFGLDLYQNLAAQNPENNCFVSPASAAICLNMAAAGASGATLDAMNKGLHLPNGNFDRAAAFGELIDSLKSKNKGAEINIANAIFVNAKFPLNADYSSAVSKSFKSEIRNENFDDDPGTTKKINDWCSESTKGHIPIIVNQVTPTEVAVLLNAIYFKGKWFSPFPAANTTGGDFAQSGNSPLKVKYMCLQHDFSYFEDKNFQAIELPYEGEQYEAIVFLPHKNVKLADFRKSITAANWDKWMTRFEPYENSYLELPRFHVDYSVVLNDSLKASGFGDMFSDNADFSKMHSPPPKLTVSEVVHKTTLDVDEQGTVATAVTSVEELMPTAMAPQDQKRFEMKVNRPFVFAIRDFNTGTLLFIGSVIKPDNAVNTR